jgi:hypothetical protein
MHKVKEIMAIAHDRPIVAQKPQGREAGWGICTEFSLFSSTSIVPLISL